MSRVLLLLAALMLGACLLPDPGDVYPDAGDDDDSVSDDDDSAGEAA